MQYLVSVIDDKANSGTPDEMAAINAFNDRLEAEGHWVFAGGLSSPSSATVIDNRDGAGFLAGASRRRRAKGSAPQRGPVVRRASSAGSATGRG